MLSLKLELRGPRPELPEPLACRWKDAGRVAGRYACAVAFLGELLALLEGAPARPAFACRAFEAEDAMGERNLDWSLHAKSAAITRELRREATGDWGRLETSVDRTQIEGLPPGVFLHWDGDWEKGIVLGVFGLPPDAAQRLEELARGLFAEARVSLCAPSDVIISRTVFCRACKGPAGTYELVPKGVRHPKADAPAGEGLSVYNGIVSGQGGAYIVTGGPCGGAAHGVKAEKEAAVRQALLRQDWAALRKLDPEFAPGYCGLCATHYCAKEWTKDVMMDEGFYDCTYGVCPAGHEQLLDD